MYGAPGAPPVLSSDECIIYRGLFDRTSPLKKHTTLQMPLNFSAAPLLVHYGVVCVISGYQQGVPAYGAPSPQAGYVQQPPGILASSSHQPLSLAKCKFAVSLPLSLFWQRWACMMFRLLSPMCRIYSARLCPLPTASTGIPATARWMLSPVLASEPPSVKFLHLAQACVWADGFHTGVRFCQQRACLCRIQCSPSHKGAELRTWHGWCGSRSCGRCCSGCHDVAPPPPPPQPSKGGRTAGRCCSGGLHGQPQSAKGDSR